jgi:hypothetical protein
MEGRLAFNNHRHVYVSSVLPHPIEAIWEKISSFYDLSWGGITSHPENEQHKGTHVVGSHRIIDLGGKIIKERLTAYSEIDHSQSYYIVSKDEGIFPGDFINYHATFSLKKVTDGNKTFAEWKATFDGDENAGEVANFIAQHVFQNALNKLK